jgi:probable rRNA maturation factor
MTTEHDELTLDVVVNADVPLPDSITENSLNSLITAALEAESQSGEWEVSLLFTSDDVIQARHLEFMELDSPTDIMTFPYEQDAFTPSELASRGGDIVISVDTARDHLVDVPWSLDDELRFLVLHGVLHLLDWDDDTTEKRARMLARQTEMLPLWSANQTATGDASS